MNSKQLFDKSVYTIVQLTDLDDHFYAGGSATITQGKPWTGALALFKEATSTGLELPIFFSNAHGVGTLYYWAIITDLKIRGKSTTFTFEKMRRFTNVPSTDNLQVASTGKPMSVRQQSPYVICETPAPGSQLYRLTEESVTLDDEAELAEKGERFIGCLYENEDDVEPAVSIDRAVFNGKTIEFDWIADFGVKKFQGVRGHLSASSKDGVTFVGKYGFPLAEDQLRTEVVRRADDEDAMVFDVGLSSEADDGVDRQDMILYLWPGLSMDLAEDEEEEEYEPERDLDDELEQLNAKYADKPNYRTIIVKQIERPAAIRSLIIERNETNCQICGCEAFLKKDGEPYVEVHHMIELNKRAPKTLQSWNVIVVCPTCHRKLHHADVETKKLKNGWEITINGELSTVGS